MFSKCFGCTKEVPLFFKSINTFFLHGFQEHGFFRSRSELGCFRDG